MGAGFVIVNHDLPFWFFRGAGFVIVHPDLPFWFLRGAGCVDGETGNGAKNRARWRQGVWRKDVFADIASGTNALVNVASRNMGFGKVACGKVL